MIYTGLRPTELLEILTENVHLEEKYMIGGIKTDAGKDRIIPLNDKIIPLIKNRYEPNRKTENETPDPRWQTHLCFSYGQCRSKRCMYRIDYVTQHEK